MGNPDSAKPYRDEDPDAVSLHTTVGEPSYAHVDEDVLDLDGAAPPAYGDTETTTSAMETPTSTATPAIPFNDNFDAEEWQTGTTIPETHIAFASNRIGQKRTRIGNEVISLQEPRSDADPQFLEGWIRRMASLPPSPYINITGTHQETRRDKDGKSKREEVTDFRIMVNMQNYLWPNFVQGAPGSSTLSTVESGEKTYRGTVLKKRQDGVKGDIEVGHAKPTLKEWCHRYCAKANGTKVFRLTRNVTGMDETFLRSALESWVRSTNYKGKLEIEFPVADRAVDIYSSNRLNKMRLTTWICWIFYLTFLWIFSWPVLFFITKRYQVVSADWAFSRTAENGAKSYTTVNEHQWTEMYGPAVKQLCLDRYQGLAGDSFLNEVLERQRESNHNEHAETARAAMSVANAAFQGGRFNAVSGARSLMRFAGASSDQIGWGFDT
ncbi:hypothetical protein F53441_5752 [Fusarium austroafricanum]|uniref:Uncharacterized protein n=1 Tax=Fusarium austroafricanum TaxID=2364996 RepID=A0A8H4KJF9_9HYPO|nr:hypothetical protein F53441_5752 [Fusarium austroafricanum]